MYNNIQIHDALQTALNVYADKLNNLVQTPYEVIRILQDRLVDPQWQTMLNDWLNRTYGNHVPADIELEVKVGDLAVQDANAMTDELQRQRQMGIVQANTAMLQGINGGFNNSFNNGFGAPQPYAPIPLYANGNPPQMMNQGFQQQVQYDAYGRPIPQYNQPFQQQRPMQAYQQPQQMPMQQMQQMYQQQQQPLQTLDAMTQAHRHALTTQAAMPKPLNQMSANEVVAKRLVNQQYNPFADMNEAIKKATNGKMECDKYGNYLPVVGARPPRAPVGARQDSNMQTSSLTVSKIPSDVEMAAMEAAKPKYELETFKGFLEEDVNYMIEKLNENDKSPFDQLNKELYQIKERAIAKSDNAEDVHLNIIETVNVTPRVADVKDDEIVTLNLTNDRFINDVRIKHLQVLDVPAREGAQIQKECNAIIKSCNGTITTDTIVKINNVLRQSRTDAYEAYSNLILKRFNDAAAVYLQCTTKTGEHLTFPTVDSLTELERVLKCDRLHPSIVEIMRNPRWQNNLAACIKASYSIIFGRCKGLVDTSDIMVKHAVLERLKTKTSYTHVRGGALLLITDEKIKAKVDEAIEHELENHTVLALQCDMLTTNAISLQRAESELEFVRPTDNSFGLLTTKAESKVHVWFDRDHETWFRVGVGLDGNLALVRLN